MVFQVNALQITDKVNLYVVAVFSNFARDLGDHREIHVTGKSLKASHANLKMPLHVYSPAI